MQVAYFTLHRVSKNKQNCFCHNFVKFPPTLIIFGTNMANSLKLYEVHSFSTLPNLCQRTAVLVEISRSYDKNNFACFFSWHDV